MTCIADISCAYDGHMETNHTHLATNAITVDCVKKQRENHNAPAVVEQQKQSNVQHDWFIGAVRVNGIVITDWLASLDLPTDAMTFTTKPFKTKKSALAYCVEVFADALDSALPEWEWQDETDCPEYFKVIAALKAAR
jgi:hypothetical protein